MGQISSDTYRFERITREESLRKYIYENGITLDNYREHKEKLVPLFPDEETYDRFVEDYMTSVELISFRMFLKLPQRMDLYLHPRYIQQAPHMHDFFEMKVQLRGSGTVHVGSDIFFLKESGICLISPYVSHSSEVYTEDAEMINIVLPPEYIQELLPRLMSFPNLFSNFFLAGEQEYPLLSNDRCLTVNAEHNSEVMNTFSRMLELFSGTEKISAAAQFLRESMLENAFLLLLSSMPDGFAAQTNSNTENSLMAAVTDYIRNHLKDASLTDIADLLHFSTAYTSRMIRKQTGYTFHMIHQIIRMEEAARLLKETDWPVEQIAEEIGFSGKTNFYKQFRCIYGLNPAKFRSNQSNEN